DHELDDGLAAVEITVAADQAADEGGAHEGFQSVARSDQHGCDGRRLNREIDQRGAEPDARPGAVAEQEACREGNARRWPYRRCVSGRDREQQRELCRREVHTGEQEHLTAVRYPLDVGRRLLHSLPLAQTSLKANRDYTSPVAGDVSRRCDFLPPCRRTVGKKK